MNALKYYRLKSGLTQQELSDLTGVPQPVISQYESGLSGTPENLEKIFDTLAPRLSGSITEPGDLRGDLDVPGGD